jgi:hypothetical protein
MIYYSKDVHFMAHEPHMVHQLILCNPQKYPSISKNVC